LVYLDLPYGFALSWVAYGLPASRVVALAAFSRLNTILAGISRLFHDTNI